MANQPTHAERKAEVTKLRGVAHTLHEEADKLAKKKPDLVASDLMVERINQLIVRTTALIVDDDFLEQAKPFVPAGENPEMRDVVLVAGELSSSLDRFRIRHRLFD